MLLWQMRKYYHKLRHLSFQLAHNWVFAFADNINVYFSRLRQCACLSGCVLFPPLVVAYFPLVAAPICQSVRPVCQLYFLPDCLPAHLPICQPSYLLIFLPAQFPTAHLPSKQCLPTYLPTCMLLTSVFSLLYYTPSVKSVQLFDLIVRG